jgi:hypothetical protein
MKLKTLLFAAFAAAGLANVASAQTTVIDITGATAFRNAASLAIRDSYSTTPAVVQYGYTGTAFTAATNQIFKGTYPGITGTTIIRTFWSGSTEGARDVVGDLTVNSYLPTTASVSTAGTPSLTGATAPGTPELYFTDVGIENTVYSPSGVNASDDTRVGAIVFSFIKNHASSAFNGLTNVTSQQWRAMLSPAVLGRVQLSQFTGLDTDDNKFVYATGRNDFSGTRTVYMLESGYGAANLVNQWKIFSNTTNVMTTIQLWPAGDNTPGNDNRSLQWTLGADIEGNGGYFSGGVLRDNMDNTSPSVDVKAPDGSIIESAKDVCMVAWLGNGDATTAISNGAVALTYNGVGYTPATPISPADKAKIQNGSYTGWSFERFYKSNEATGGTAANTVYTTVFAAILGGSGIGSAGLTMGEMSGVERTTDGGTVTIP